MKLFYISAAGALMCLGACATPGKLDPKVEIKDVPVAVAISCVPKDTPAPGAYADDAIAQVQDPVERTKLRGAANQQRKARLAVIEPIVQGCR